MSSYFTWTDAVDESDDTSFTSWNNGEGPARYTDSWTRLDLFAHYDFDFESVDARISFGIRNVFDEEILRWEVISNARQTDSSRGFFGFFEGVEGDGWKRYTDPGRSYQVTVDIGF